MGSEQYQETYEILSGALSFHQAYEMANVDGKIDVSDIGLVFVPLVKLPAAIAGADKALKELPVMDAASRAEMLEKLAAEYDIPDDKIEAKVEAAVEWLVSTGKFVGVLIA